jgi:hypothetical protein
VTPSDSDPRPSSIDRHPRGPTLDDLPDVSYSDLYHYRKEMGLPRRERPPRTVENILREANSCLRIAPDASTVLCRKAVQGTLLRLVPDEVRKGRGPCPTCGRSSAPWREAMAHLKKARRLSDTWIDASVRVILTGNLGAHADPTASRRDARSVWELAKFVLDELGFEMGGFGGAIGEHRVQERFGLGRAPRWEGPERFKESIEGLYRGGLVDVLFRCPQCRGLVFVEDLLVEWSGPEGLGGGQNEESCRKCGMHFEVTSDVDREGWWVSADELGEGQVVGTKPPRISRALPAIGSFLFRILIDFQDEENEFVESQLSEDFPNG